MGNSDVSPFQTDIETVYINFDEEGDRWTQKMSTYIDFDKETDGHKK